MAFLKLRWNSRSVQSVGLQLSVYVLVSIPRHSLYAPNWRHFSISVHVYWIQWVHASMEWLLKLFHRMYVGLIWSMSLRIGRTVHSIRSRCLCVIRGVIRGSGGELDIDIQFVTTVLRKSSPVIPCTLTNIVLQMNKVYIFTIKWHWTHWTHIHSNSSSNQSELTVNSNGCSIVLSLRYSTVWPLSFLMLHFRSRTNRPENLQ